MKQDSQKLTTKLVASLPAAAKKKVEVTQARKGTTVRVKGGRVVATVRGSTARVYLPATSTTAVEALATAVTAAAEAMVAKPARSTASTKRTKRSPRSGGKSSSD